MAKPLAQLSIKNAVNYEGTLGPVGEPSCRLLQSTMPHAQSLYQGYNPVSLNFTFNPHLLVPI